MTSAPAPAPAPSSRPRDSHDSPRPAAAARPAAPAQPRSTPAPAADRPEGARPAGTRTRSRGGRGRGGAGSAAGRGERPGRVSQQIRRTLRRPSGPAGGASAKRAADYFPAPVRREDCARRAAGGVEEVAATCRGRDRQRHIRLRRRLPVRLRGRESRRGLHPPQHRLPREEPGPRARRPSLPTATSTISAAFRSS